MIDTDQGLVAPEDASGISITTQLCDMRSVQPQSARAIALRIADILVKELFHAKNGLTEDVLSRRIFATLMMVYETAPSVLQVLGPVLWCMFSVGSEEKVEFWLTQWTVERMNNQELKE